MSDENPETDQRTSMSAADRGPREIGVNDIVRWLRYYWLIILLCAVLGGIAASIYSANARPTIYRASAILAIVPPAFSSELLPSTLTIQGYQELLGSDAVRAATAARLIEEGVLPEGSQLRGGQVNSTIFVSERREETLLAPMIRLEARSDSADRAAAIANTWAEVFQERVTDLMFGTTSITVQFIENQYPKARDRLATLENTWLEVATALDRKEADAVNRWLQEASQGRAETSRLINEYEAETNHLVSDYRAEHRLVARRGELDSLIHALEEHHRERFLVDARLRAAEHGLKQVEKQLADTDRTLVLKRSLGEEVVVGEALESRDRSFVNVLENLRLSYEMMNPTFNHLTRERNRIGMEVAVLRPRAQDLDDLITRKSDQMEKLERSLLKDESALYELRAAREIGLTALQEGRTTSEATIETERDRELTAIDRERDSRLLQLDRQIAQERALFEELADKYNEALLAKGQERSEAIRVAAPAVPPATPLPVGSGQRNIILGLLLGAILGAMIAGLRSALASGTTA